MEFLEGRIFSDVRMLSLPFEERKLWQVKADVVGARRGSHTE